MGSRAAFIVKRDGVAKVYGSRLAGSSTVAWLLRGPEKASARFAGESEMEDLEDVLGGDDGSALIDWDAKVVRWQMANCQLPLQQRLTNRMIEQAFSGWDVAMHRDLFELTEYVGIDSGPYFESELTKDELTKDALTKDELTKDELTKDELTKDEAVGEGEFEEESQESEEDSEILDEDSFWDPPVVSRPVYSLDEIGDAGCWVTVRYEDGSIVDHFGFGNLSNLLLQGERFAQSLRHKPTTDRQPEELITLDGIWIDWRDKKLWRWNVEAVAAAELRLETIWDGWTLHQFPGGDWRGHVETTMRESGDLGCSQREILAATVRQYTPHDHDPSEPTLENLVTHARRGCISFTAIIGVVALSLFYFFESKWMGVTVGVIFAVCLVVTTRFIAMSSRMIRNLDLNESPEDRNSTMDGILVGLGYPTIDELRSAGEFGSEDELADDEDQEEQDEEFNHRIQSDDRP